jgi:hypothetical protein
MKEISSLQLIAVEASSNNHILADMETSVTTHLLTFGKTDSENCGDRYVQYSENIPG